MLVLSRRAKEKICFPNLGISVEVARIKGNTVRLGIDAPKDVKVVRQEILDSLTSQQLTAQIEKNSGQLSHDMRNRLNTVTLALHMMEKQLEAGMLSGAEKSLQKALSEVRAFDEQIGAVDSRPNAEPKPLSRRALLVEDDTNERELLSGILQMSGFTIETAPDGLAAMGYLNSHELPDVILMDMRMPRFDGPKTVSAIRSIPSYSGVKLFAVSATDPRELGVSTGPLGIDRWFSKPLDPASLVGELNRELAA